MRASSCGSVESHAPRSSQRWRTKRPTVSAPPEPQRDTVQQLKDLADLKLLKPICKKLGDLAALHVIEGADHSFHVLKSSGKSDADILRELAHTTAEWAASLK